MKNFQDGNNEMGAQILRDVLAVPGARAEIAVVHERGEHDMINRSPLQSGGGRRRAVESGRKLRSVDYAVALLHLSQ